MIHTDRLGVLCSEMHPFAGRATVMLDELRQEKLLVAGRLMQPLSSPPTTNSVNDVLNRNGLLPHVTYVARTLSNMILMVDCNMGVALVPSRIQAHAPETVRFRPIACGPDSQSPEIAIQTIAIWKEDRKNPCITNATDTIDAILEEQAEGCSDYQAE